MAVSSVSLVAQSCPTLCDPINHSTPCLPVHHQLPEFTQTHVHWVGDAIQPSHPLSSPSPPAPNPTQHQSLFQWVNSSHEVTKVLEFQLQHQSFLMQKSSGSLNHLWEPAGDSTSLCVTHNSRVTGSWFLWFKWLSKSCGSLYILCILLIPLKTGELWSYLVIRLEWMSKWDVCHLQNPKETARCCAPVIVVENLKSFVIQSCPTLCDPMNCDLPGSSVHGIFQARVLEWVAISFSRGSSQPRDQTQVSHIVGRCFIVWATREVTNGRKDLILHFGRTSELSPHYWTSNIHPDPWDLMGFLSHPLTCVCLNNLSKTFAAF